MHKKALSSIFFSLLLFSIWVPFSQSTEYSIIKIDPILGRERCRVYGINNFGQIAGKAYDYDTVTQSQLNRLAFIWDPIKGYTVLPSLIGDEESGVWGINDHGQVSGYSYNSQEHPHAVRWDETTGLADEIVIVDIGTVGNISAGLRDENSFAYNLNNNGQVIGYTDIPNEDRSFIPFHAFIYDDTMGLRELGTLTTRAPYWQNGYSIAYDINNNQVAVGIASNVNWNYGPFIYDDTNGMKELKKDPLYSNGEWYAVVINDANVIGGHVIAAMNQSLPYIWRSPLSEPTPLSMPDGFPYGEIYGINESGQVVGVMWEGNQENASQHAFVYDPVNGVLDLNDLIDNFSGWILDFALQINDSGQISGSGEYNGLKRGFILNPLPSCQGDFDYDGDVDGSDLAVFIADLGRINCSGDCPGDFDLDGDVDWSDLFIFAANFRQRICPTP